GRRDGAPARGPARAAPADGEDDLRASGRRERQDPGLLQDRRPRRRPVRGGEAARPRGRGRGRGATVSHEDRGGHRAGRAADAPGEVAAAAAARQGGRERGPPRGVVGSRAPCPPALRRPRGTPRGTGDLPAARASGELRTSVPRCPRLPRSRNTRAAAAVWRGHGATVSFEPPLARRDYYTLVRETAGIDLARATEAELRAALRRKEVDADALTGAKLVDEVFKNYVEPTLVQPTFVLDYPVALSPLAKLKRGDPTRVERWELFIQKRELANAFSELNDPEEQRRRFEQQARLRAAGDTEAQ